MSSNTPKSMSVSWLSLKKKRMNLETTVPEFYSLSLNFTPYSIDTLSSRQVMSVKKNINQGIIE